MSAPFLFDDYAGAIADGELPLNFDLCHCGNFKLSRHHTCDTCAQEIEADRLEIA